MFDRIFDFNRDGKTDMFELALGLSVAFSEEKKGSEIEEYSESSFAFFDDEADDDRSPGISISNLEWERGALVYRLSELQDRLFDLEDEEPDDYACASYDCWERRKNRLSEQIFDLEEQISEIEELISFDSIGIRTHAV